MPQQVIAYVRVSTEKQAGPDKVSLAEQARALRRLAEDRGYQLIEPPEACAIEGCWGDVFSAEALEKRPGIMAVLGRVKEGGVSALLVYDQSRLARDELVGQLIVRDLKRHRANLVTLSQEYDFTNDTHQTLYGFQSVADAHWKRAMQAAMKRGQEGRAREGRWACAVHLYGYIWNRELKAPVIDEAEAATVREVFRIGASEQLSCEAIADQLNRRGIPARGRSRPRGTGPWFGSLVRRIFANPRYKGEGWETAPGVPVRPEYGACRIIRDQDGKPLRDSHDRLITEPAYALVDPETWAITAMIAEIHRKNQHPWVKRRFLLCGMIRCGYCGGGMTTRVVHPKSDRRYTYYGCNRAIRSRLNHCPQRHIRTQELDDLVWGYVMDLARDPAQIQAAARETKRRHFAEWREQLKQIYGDLKGLRMRLGRARVAYERKVYTLEEYEQSRAEIEPQEAELEERRARLERLAKDDEERQVAVESTAEALRLAGALDALPLEAKRRLLTRLGMRLTVWGHERRRLEWYGAGVTAAALRPALSRLDQDSCQHVL